MSPEPVLLKKVKHDAEVDLSDEALRVRQALINHGLETPMVDNGLDNDQKYQRIRHLDDRCHAHAGTGPGRR